MQNNFISDIKISSRIIIYISILLMTLISSSIFLTLFITTLTLIIMILVDKSVNEYVYFIKRIILFLLFISLAYIIGCRGVSLLDFILFEYKLIILSILLRSAFDGITLKTLSDGIYTLIPLGEKSFDIKSVALNISLNIYFLIYYIKSFDEIKKAQALKGKRKRGFKYFLIPRMLLAMKNTVELKTAYLLKYSEVKKEKLNFKSILFVLLFMILFVIAIYKEVI